MASFYVRELRNSLDLQPLSMFPDYGKPVSCEYDLDEILRIIEVTKEEIRKAEQLCPTMINCFYKMGELLTLAIMIKRDRGVDYGDDLTLAKDAFEKAEKKNSNHLSYLYCKYGFLTLFEETKDRAAEVKDHIQRQKGNMSAV